MAIDQNTERQPNCPPQLAILGTLPPLRAISHYCEGLVATLVEITHVEFISFAHLYPKKLYPGAALEEDNEPPKHPHLTIRRELSWFNPLSWVQAGFRVQSPALILQWWSLPLSPVLLTVAMVARLRGKRVVTTLHNITPHSGRSWLYRLATRMILMLSHGAIVHSERNAEQLTAELRQDKDSVWVLPMGAADYRQGRSIEPATSRIRLQLPTDRPILLMFGALRDYKGLDVALEAMQSVIESTPKALLLVAGQPWRAEEHYRNQVRSMGLEQHVRLDLAFVPDDKIHDYLSAADLLLLPYKHFDAQSAVGVYALPYGIPLIVSDCGSLPELVRDPASVVRPGNAQQLAARISAVLSSSTLLEQLSADATELSRRHSWTSIAQELCRQVDELLSSPQEEQAG
jgi:glycosyltransferase involved in cell wall biosynthesis